VGVVGAVLHSRSFQEPPVHAGETFHPWTGSLGQLPPPGGESLQECDWVAGAALMLRMRAQEEAGGFDEAFYLYWEEVELSLRWRKFGWRTVVAPRARGIHLDKGGGPEPSLALFMQWRNRWLLISRAMPWSRRPVAHLMTLLYALRDVLGRLVHGGWGSLWIPLRGNLYGILGWYGRAGVEAARSTLTLAGPAASGDVS
jgi:GT2 family glycosyltransferase